MKKDIYIQYFVIIISIIIVSIIWEFGGEVTINHYFDREIDDENIDEKVEYVLTISIFCLLSLVYPFIRSLKLEKKRVLLECEREELISDLRLTLEEIKVLKGLIPVCSYCKKIRNEEGAWSRMEEYLSAHTEVTFTHGACPDCYSKHMDSDN